jgi:PAS domain S-box-containing protein
MDPSTQMGQLLGLAGVLAGKQSPDLVIEAALPALLEVAGAHAVLVLSPTAEGLRVSARAGTDLDAEAVQEGYADDSAPTNAGSVLTSRPVPTTWETDGIARVATHQLPGAAVVLLAWSTEEPDSAALELALTTVDTAVARAHAEEKLADLTARVNNAQQLANMGDYDWHIPTDTNRWSDQLFRIYGHDPQTFEPSYAKFLSLIHEDDRDRITALHQNAYATGEPYKMIERIVRPDGEVRFLSSNGEVIMDGSSTPVRMRGTCIDITDRVLADRERERIANRFQGLVDSAPDAILILDSDQQVMEANQRAHELLGGDAQGHRIHEILPSWPRGGTAGVHASALDGRTLQLDLISVLVEPEDDDSDGDTLVALFLRDAEARLGREALAARLGEAQLRRRQALEINDNVVQGLVAAVYALDQGQAASSADYLGRTLSAARAMMDDLLEPLDGEGLQPGDLVRTAPALVGGEPRTTTNGVEQTMASQSSRRVLVVDDAEDLRTLLRLRMESRDGLSVVGEAADGVAAVEMASELQPDLVMLDLAMPRMDGLEALPLIRAAVPGVRVIVLSGFNQSTLAERAIEAGADHYVVKGGSMRELLDLIEEVLAPASGTAPSETGIHDEAF